ncbi:MAG: hypothetical protein AAF789_01920 [Bacteroidota bacterium]
MMRLRIETEVNSSLATIKAGFTQELFLALNPPFPPVKLNQFDGCEKGDWVKLQLNFFLFKQEWVSLITEDSFEEKKWYFVDEGKKLPVFLQKWKHRHIVQQKEGFSLIIDDITFSTGTVLTNLLMLPALYLQFLYRKPIYKKSFSK